MGGTRRENAESWLAPLLPPTAPANISVQREANSSVVYKSPPSADQNRRRLMYNHTPTTEYFLDLWENKFLNTQYLLFYYYFVSQATNFL